MSSIDEAILFISSASKACVPCVREVSRFRIPVQIIKLDTEAARAKAASGKYFQIHAVPSLVVVFEQGNIQQFLGAEKILQWVKMVTSRPPPPPEETPYRPIGTPTPLAGGSVPVRPGNLYGDDLPPRRPRQRVVDDPDDDEEPTEDRRSRPKFVTIPRSKGKDAGKQRKPLIGPPDDEEPVTELGEEPVEKPKKKGSRKDKKGKKKGVKFDIPTEVPGPDDADDVTDIDNGLAAPKKARSRREATQKLQQRPEKPSRMKGLIESAKQMEEDRKNTLKNVIGYDEEDLPKY